MDAEAIGKMLEEKLKEHDKNKVDRHISASTATNTRVSALLTEMKFLVSEELEASAVMRKSSVPLSPFVWGETHEDAASNMSNAKLFIEKSLKAEGASIGSGGYKVHEVHSIKTILNAETDAIDFRSGTHFIITSDKTPTFTAPSQATLVIELKTAERFKSEMLQASESQALVKLFRSNQMLL